MISIWQDAVFDRTQADVDRINELLSKVRFSDLTLEEKAELLTDSKGALNTSDLERIKNNIDLMAEVMELRISTTDVPEIPTQAYFDEIRRNVQTIRNAGFIRNTTPKVPKAPLNTYQKWNDIEKILHDTYDILMNNFHYYAGEQLYSGDSVALLL
jgi:hypothetical protein